MKVELKPPKCFFTSWRFRDNFFLFIPHTIFRCQKGIKNKSLIWTTLTHTYSGLLGVIVKSHVYTHYSSARVLVHLVAVTSYPTFHNPNFLTGHPHVSSVTSMLVLVTYAINSTIICPEWSFAIDFSYDVEKSKSVCVFYFFSF